MSAPENNSVTHVDIYLKLGEVIGTLNALQTSLTEKRSDLSGAFNRIRELEMRVSLGVGIAILLSVIVPLAVTALKPTISLPALERIQSNERIRNGTVPEQPPDEG